MYCPLHNPYNLICPVCIKKPTTAIAIVKRMVRDDHVTLGILQDWYILDQVISKKCFYVVMARKSMGTAPEG